MPNISLSAWIMGLSDFHSFFDLWSIHGEIQDSMRTVIVFIRSQVIKSSMNMKCIVMTQFFDISTRLRGRKHDIRQMWTALQMLRWPAYRLHSNTARVHNHDDGRKGKVHQSSCHCIDWLQVQSGLWPTYYTTQNHIQFRHSRKRPFFTMASLVCPTVRKHSPPCWLSSNGTFLGLELGPTDMAKYRCVLLFSK